MWPREPKMDPRLPRDGRWAVGNAPTRRHPSQGCHALRATTRTRASADWQNECNETNNAHNCPKSLNFFPCHCQAVLRWWCLTDCGFVRNVSSRGKRMKFMANVFKFVSVSSGRSRGGWGASSGWAAGGVRPLRPLCACAPCRGGAASVAPSPSGPSPSAKSGWARNRNFPKKLSLTQCSVEH